jgi:hypothetical protein
MATVVPAPKTSSILDFALRLRGQNIQKDQILGQHKLDKAKLALETDKLALDKERVTGLLDYQQALGKQAIAQAGLLDVQLPVAEARAAHAEEIAELERQQAIKSNKLVGFELQALKAMDEEQLINRYTGSSVIQMLNAQNRQQALEIQGLRTGIQNELTKQRTQQVAEQNAESLWQRNYGTAIGSLKASGLHPEEVAAIEARTRAPGGMPLDVFQQEIGRIGDKIRATQADLLREKRDVETGARIQEVSFNEMIRDDELWHPQSHGQVQAAMAAGKSMKEVIQSVRFIESDALVRAGIPLVGALISGRSNRILFTREEAQRKGLLNDWLSAGRLVATDENAGTATIKGGKQVE